MQSFLTKRIAFFLFFLPLSVIAQTYVSGRIIDENGMPLPYANIIFKRSSVGCYSDNDGYFTLKSEKNFSEIEVSNIGFVTKEVRLKEKTTKDLQIILTEGEELSEVTIVGKPTKRLSKKENPAYKILQNIWKNKQNNGLKQAKYYQYKKYTSTELGLSHLDSTFLKKALQSDYQEIRSILSEKKYKEFFSMPMYLKEIVEKIYGNKNGQIRTDIEAERTQGVAQTGFGLERIARVFQEFDVYDNSIFLLEKPFVSPVSEFGYGSYDYVLNDSIVRDGQTFYTIYFFPRQEQDLAFQGKFSVGNKNYAIESIQMTIGKETNLNLVRYLSFEKKFNIQNDNIYLPEQDTYEGDFSLFTKNDEEKGMYMKKVVTFSDYELDKELPSEFYSEKIVQTRSNQFVKENAYWDSLPNMNTEMLKTQNLIANIRSNKRIKGVSDVINIISTGYIPIGKYMEFGSFWETFSTNDVEGTRWRTGFRSFISTDDRFRTYFYGAYGTKDKKIKYGISGKYLLFHEPRITIGAAFRDDYAQLGSFLFKDDANLDFKNFTNMLFSRGENYFLTHNKQLEGMLNIATLNDNLHFTLLGTYQKMKPASPEHFSIAYENDEHQVIQSFSDANLGFSVTYTPRRYVYGYGVEQRLALNIHPTYKFKVTKGFSGIRNSSFDYTKTEAMVNYPISVWSFGMLHTTLEAGKIFGTLPLPLLAPTPANQTYSIVDRTFNLLDYYDFINDTYVNVYFEHHFNGFIFNRIPLLKKTKWQSVLFARAAYGQISDKNIQASHSNIHYNSPERVYWEYGFGIENIGFGNLRPIRVDFIWRNNFKEYNGGKNPSFGVRVGIIPKF